MSTTLAQKSDVRGHPIYFKCSAFVVGLGGFLPSLDRGQHVALSQMYWSALAYRWEMCSVPSSS